MTFDQMSVQQAIDYCERHKDAFLTSIVAAGEDGADEEYEHLLRGLRNGSITPAQLPKMGMSFWDGPSTK